MWSASRPGRLYPRERPSTHCTGGWVDPGAGLDRCGKSRLTGIRSPDLPACSESLHRLRYPAPPYICVHINVRKQNICCCLCGVSSVLNTFFSQNCAVIGSSRSEIVFCIFGLSRWIKKCRNKVTVTCMQSKQPTRRTNLPISAIYYIILACIFRLSSGRKNTRDIKNARENVRAFEEVAHHN